MKKNEHEKLVEVAVEHFIALMRESREKIDTAIESILDEAAAHETDPTLKVGFSISLDLDKHQAEFTLAFGLRHKLTSDAEIPDPDQGELVGIDGESVTGKLKPKRRAANN